MGRRNFTREFKVSAVRLVQEQGYTVTEAAKSLGVEPASIRDWLKKFSPEARNQAPRKGSPIPHQRAKQGPKTRPIRSWMMMG